MPLTLNRKKNYGASDAEGGNALAVNQNQQTAQALKTGAYNPTGASPSLTPKASGPNEEFIKPNGFVVAKANNVYNVARTAAERTADLTWAKPVAARKVSDVYGGYNSLGEQKAASRLSSQGSFASAREAEAAVWLASGNDQVARDNAYTMLDQDYDTPGSSFYNPYRKTTNQKALDELSALGIDTSGGVNDAFFARNSAYMQYSRTGAAGTPLAPSKNSSKENNAAYWLYQLQKDEETTKSAESEWNDMVKTISYWTNKGLSDDEIIAKAKAGKHTTLDKLDAGRQAGVPVQLNRSVGYSEDAMYGAIWAARNGDASGDYFGDSVRYALGQGKSYASSSRKEAQRDASSAEYQPYTSGSTMDDARMAFGVDRFDRDWLNTNKTIMNGTDEKTQTLYQKVYAAEDVTEKAESELSALKQALVAQASAWKGTAGELVQALLGQDTYATLRKMDAARNAGDPLALTRSVDYRDTDMVRYAQTLLTGGKKISRKDAAGMATPATDTVSGASQTAGMTAAPSSNGVPAASPEANTKPESDNASVASPGDASVASGKGPRVALTAEGASEALKGKNAAETSAEGQTDGLVAQRQELIDQLAGYRNSEIKGQTLDKQKADVVAQINALTAQIGDKYAVRVDYTPEQLKSVLTKVFSGSGGLDEQEQAVFDSFTDEYHGLFGTADTQGAGGQYKYFSESSDFGKTAAEALTWADDKDASSDDMVKVMTTIAQDWQDARTDALTRAETDQGVIAQAAQQGITPAQWVQQNASQVPVDLDAWYETHPQDKADLLSVKDSVNATRDAQAQKAAADAEETKKANLSACADVMKTVAGGGKLTDQQQTVYNAIQSIPESTIQQDTGYADRYTSLANSVADGSLAVKLNLGEQDVWKANDYASYIENYYAKDAKVAAACGMTLDEMYQKFPQMQKSDEQLLQMATQDYDDKWTVTDDQDSAAGLGFWKTVGLGVSSGAQDWWAGKVNFTSAVLDQKENVTSAANYGTYVDKYGYANARSAYRSDVQKAIEAMPDGDRKTRYQQMLEASNGKDIFNLPFNFTVEQLNDYHEQIVQNIQSQSDLVQKYGTTFEKNTVYPVSRSVTNNSISMTEATVVRGAATAMGIPGVVASDLGTLAGYGEAQFGDTYWEAKNHGLSVDGAKCLATLQTAITAMMEGPMLEKYVGGDLGEGIVAAVTEQAKQEGAGFFKRLGANALRYAMNGLGEAVQENAEDIAGGVVNALAYGDASELTSQLDPQKIIETSVMSFVTSLFLSAQGDLTQKAVGALSGGTAAAEETKQAQTDQTQTPGDQSAQTQTDQTAQTENTNDKKQDEGNSSKSSVDPQALAVNAVRAMLESSEVMSQVTDAVAGKLTVDKIGQGAMNTEAVQAVTERSQQAQETLDKAAQEMNAARKALTVVSGKLTQLTEKAGTPEGAQQIAQLTQQAAQIRERYLAAKESQSKAQTAADSAAQDMESVRKGTYRQVQAEARAEAQEQVQAQAESAREMLANPGATTYNQAMGGEVNGQQQTIEGADHQGELAVAPGRADGPGSVGLAGQGERSGNPGDTEGLLGQGSGRVYPGFLSEKGKDNLSAKDVSALGLTSSDNDLKRFSDALSTAKASNNHGAYVDAQSVEELTERGAKTFLSDDGLAGIAVGTVGKEQGNIFAVFKDKSSKARHASVALTIEAIGNGGNKLDNFNGGLSKMYASVGFIPVCRIQFNEEYMPEGWNTQRDDHPDVVFWMHNGDSAQTVAEKYGTYKIYSKEEIGALPLIEGTENDYDAAWDYRDRKLAEHQAQSQTGAAGLTSAGPAPSEVSPMADMSAAPQTNSSDGVIPGGPVDGATENQGSASGPQRQFGAQTAQESDAIHESVKDYLREHSAYDPQSDQTLIDKAIDRVMTSDYNNLVADFTHDDLKTLNSPENQALGVVLMGMAAQNNDVRTEMDIADTYNRMGTEAGRTLQARKVFDLMSPLGAVKYVQKTIGEVNSRYAGQTGKEGVTVSEDTIRRIGEAQTLEDRQDAVDAAMKEITSQIKPTLVDRLNSWRYLAMLGNPRTHVRNIIGNSVFAPSVAIKNKVAAAIEAMVLKPGDRTKSLAIVTDQQYREAAEQYYQQDKDRLKEGGKFDTGSATTLDMRKIEQERRSWGNTPGGRMMEWLSDKNGKALEAEDALFKSGYYKHALASWLQANKVDLQTVDESTILKAREYAFNEAQKDTYNNRSELVKMINQFENGLRNRGGGYRAGAMLMEGAIPFKNTPVNIISRGLEYSPAGLADTLIAETGKLRKGDITASQYIDKLSAGLTGTGTFALGVLLSSMGMLRASIPDDDEGKQLKLNGAQEYSVEIGGKSYTIDWTAPASIALFCGAEMQKIFQGQGVSSVGEILSAVSNLTSPIMNLTMLSGLNNLFDNNSYDEGIGSLERAGITTMESYAGQFIPTLLGQIARVIDPVRRSNYTDAANGFDSSIQYFVNKQRNKIPFLSTLSAPYVDAWGRQDVTPSVWQRMLENFVSPGYLNDLTDDQVSQGLATLAGESADTGVYPDAMPKTVTVNKQSVKLGGEQWAQYQTGAGTVSRTLIGSMLNNPDFAGLDPAYQARVVKDVYAYAKKTAQDAVTGGVKLDKWIQNAQAGDPVSVIVEREKKIQTSDYAEGTQDALQGYILQGDTGSIQTCVDALTVLGLDGNQIKTRAATAVKEAWQKGDDDTRSAIEGTLMDAGLGFTRKDFDKWLADMTKEKK